MISVGARGGLILHISIIHETAKKSKLSSSPNHLNLPLNHLTRGQHARTPKLTLAIRKLRIIQLGVETALLQ